MPEAQDDLLQDAIELVKGFTKNAGDSKYFGTMSVQFNFENGKLVFVRESTERTIRRKAPKQQLTST